MGGNFHLFPQILVMHVDSVVLSLSYAGSYGDSLASQSVNVYDINANANFCRYNRLHFYRFWQRTANRHTARLGHFHA